TTDQLDEAAFTALDLAQPGLVGWYFPGEITKADAVRQVMVGCLGWAYVGLDGLLTVVNFTAPSSTADLVLVVPGSGADTSDAAGDLLALAVANDAAPRQATYLGWGHNYTPQGQNDLAGSVSQAAALIYGKESRQVPAVDSELARNWPNAAIV